MTGSPSGEDRASLRTFQQSLAEPHEAPRIGAKACPVALGAGVALAAVPLGQFPAPMRAAPEERGHAQ
jgi:hypothetical protein